MTKTTRLITLISVAGLVLAVDQLAKWRVMQTLDLFESWEPIPAISGFFRVTHSFNTGAAFGMFPMASPVFLALAFVAVTVFSVMYITADEETLLSLISVPMIIGGALGNAVDRLRFDHVVDFFHVQVGNFANISNFADHFIVIGVVLLLIDMQVQERQQAEEDFNDISLESDLLAVLDEEERPS